MSNVRTPLVTNLNVNIPRATLQDRAAAPASISSRACERPTAVVGGRRRADPPGGAHGVHWLDTRFLSEALLTVDGREPAPLGCVLRPRAGRRLRRYDARRGHRPRRSHGAGRAHPYRDGPAGMAEDIDDRQRQDRHRPAVTLACGCRVDLVELRAVRRATTSRRRHRAVERLGRCRGRPAAPEPTVSARRLDGDPGRRSGRPPAASALGRRPSGRSRAVTVGDLRPTRSGSSTTRSRRAGSRPDRRRGTSRSPSRR